MFNISVFSSFRNSNLKNFKKLNKIYIYTYTKFIYSLLFRIKIRASHFYICIYTKEILSEIIKIQKLKIFLQKIFQRVKKKRKKEHFTKVFFTKVNSILQKLEIFEKARKYFQKLKTFYRSLKEKLIT